MIELLMEVSGPFKPVIMIGSGLLMAIIGGVAGGLMVGPMISVAMMGWYEKRVRRQMLAERERALDE